MDSRTLTPVLRVLRLCLHALLLGLLALAAVRAAGSRVNRKGDPAVHPGAMPPNAPPSRQDAK
ncbi:hypothetical protein ABZ705_33420, partial [Streptomyces sp. NPDC006984]